MAGPKGLRSAEDVVSKLGIRPALPTLRVGDVALYDRPIEHLAGHLDRSDLELPLRYFAGRYGLVLCFALESCDAPALLRDLVRVTHGEGAIWVAVWKRAFERAGVPSWEEVRSAGLATGWVDNKVLSLGDEVYATRYARRRRPSGATKT